MIDNNIEYSEKDMEEARKLLEKHVVEDWKAYCEDPGNFDKYWEEKYGATGE